MTAVTIRPTFKKDSRPNNGLEAIAGQLQGDKTRLFRVVGIVKYAGASVSEDGEITPAAKFVSLEVVFEDDSAQVDTLIDGRRKERNLGIVADIPVSGQLPGQAEFDLDGLADDEEPAETNASGDPVPPASGEEVVAELNERRARKAKAAPAADFTPPTPDGGAK